MVSQEQFLKSVDLTQNYPGIIYVLCVSVCFPSGYMAKNI